MEPRSSQELEISLIHFPLMALGPGKRVGIWTQGCSIGCPGCVSPHASKVGGGSRVKVSEIIGKVIPLLADADGVTVSGGEPFDQPEALSLLLQGLREAGCPDILVYSGYRLHDLRRRYPEILQYVDVLVDGPYLLDVPTKYPWKGSANQRLYLLTGNSVIHVRYRRFRADRKHHMQVIAESGRIMILGIPRRDDLEGILHGSR